MVTSVKKVTMASPSTYERYLRERKATVDKHRFTEKSRSMSEVVDDILEIISTDEDVLRKEANQETSLLTTQSSHATWSLSSSAIMKSWDDDDDENERAIPKSIQSYTSPVFSPLYEVRPEQQNVFQENRQPLPKAGQTPKVRNLCYNLATDISYDSAYEYTAQRESPTSKLLPVSSSRYQRAHATTERILLSISPLSISTNIEVNAKNTKVDFDQNADVLPQQLLDHPNVEIVDSTPISTLEEEIVDDFTPTQSEHVPLAFDYFYARKDWALKSYSSADSGELSLEPLLNAYSEDFDPEYKLKSDRRGTDAAEEKNIASVEESVDISTINDGTETPYSTIQPIEETEHFTEEVEQSSSIEKSIQPSFPRNISSESSNIQRKISQALTIQVLEKICMKHHAFSDLKMFDVPLTPSLLHAIDTSLVTLQSTIASSLMDYSVLVCLEKKKLSSEERTDCPAAPKDCPIDKGIQAPVSVNHRCFTLDLDAFCIHNDDDNHAIEGKCFDCDSSRSNGHRPSVPLETGDDYRSTQKAIESALEEKFENDFSGEVIDLTDNMEPAHDFAGETIDLTSSSSGAPSYLPENPELDAIPSVKSNSSDDIVEKFLRALEGAKEMGLEIDNDDETADYLMDAPPKSFDSEQFMRDMAVRLETELTSVVGNHYDDSTFLDSIEFQQLSMSLPSASRESNDGLDEELCALDMFGAELKNELEKANDTTVLIPSPQSSFCSMTTTFLSDNHLPSCISSDEDFIFPPPHIRKVHFNEQVEEFLYLAHEACGTPDAKSAERQQPDETFVDEICNVFDELLDEFSLACVSISRAMDRTRYLPKSKPIRRSSVS